MIGKTAPIVASVATAKKTGKHVFDGPENENIRVLSGSPEDILDYVQDAQTSGIKNGFVHAKIAPDHTQRLTHEQWQKVINEWCAEFKLDPENVCAVLHDKGGNAHLHIVAPGCDPVTGKRTDVSWCHLRTEKLCRKLEADFGHDHVPMKPGHVRSVAARLRAEGRPEVADAVNLNPTVQAAAFSEKQGQRLKRNDYSPTGIKRIVRSCWDCSDNAQALSNALAEFGFSVAPGKRKNVWLLLSEDGTELGALDRIVGEKRAMVTARMTPDKPRRSKKPRPLKLPQRLPDVPPQPPASSAIPEPETQPQTQQDPHHETTSQTPPEQSETDRPALEDHTRHPPQHERDLRPAGPPAAGETRGRAGPVRRDDAGTRCISADAGANKIPTSRFVETDSKDTEEHRRNKKRKNIRRQRFEAGYHRHRARLNALAHRQNKQAERERKALSRAEKYAQENPLFLGLATLATRLTGINFLPDRYTKLFKIAEDARGKTDVIRQRLETLHEQAQRAAERRLPDTDEPAIKRQEQHDRRDRIERKAQENILKSQEEARRISIAEERNISKRPDNTNELHPAPVR
ncbi:relaxase/mobilization nuclease domain-containing protein [Acetobacter cerevisiae]|uniref:Relaxase/mobilization nuclease domain-containing protein n=1 Tax=Acetobacter cerevisiae TaxID=178900 RepID=A0ABT1EV69_9PROT|nr:relaxase/mobilization nuclease domain-containing protein [Acetobacter cerevisiae]MCP1247283.1 relaxase/mobilization nuclease domain-containing protein [Acetobacter cerevisiae]MCP1256836.1 relaxase/mobilization nuclease domain-containing protein [Acetobacter cerevisiae]